MAENAVLTFDFIGSRAIAQLPKVINRGLLRINRKFEAALLARFETTLGDEFQGVLKDARQGFLIYETISRMFEQPLYCGLGVGSVQRSGDSRPSRMTGMAFIRSRAALNLAKEKKRRFVSKVGLPKIEETINALALAMDHIQRNQTPRQRQLVSLMLEQPDLTQKQLALKLRISPSAVSQSLAASGFTELVELRNAIRILLGASVGVEDLFQRDESR